MDGKAIERGRETRNREPDEHKPGVTLLIISTTLYLSLSRVSRPFVCDRLYISLPIKDKTRHKNKIRRKSISSDLSATMDSNPFIEKLSTL